MTAGDVEIDLGARKVTKGGDLVHLTPTEFALLREFVSNPGVLLTHATLLRRVWGRGYETQTEYTRVYMARLRAKLEDPDGSLAVHHRAPVRLPVHATLSPPISGPSRFFHAGGRTFAFCSRSPS